MPGHSQRCVNPDCRRPFRVNCYDRRVSVEKPAGVIVCPHCGASVPGARDSIFVTHALSRFEEDLFERIEELEERRPR